MNTLKNSVRLTGFLGSEPEVRNFSENKNMAKVSLATHERYRNSQGEWETNTQWHQLVFWGKRGRFAEKSLNKGMEVAIEGRLINRTYEDKEGTTRYVTEIVVNELLLINRKSETSPAAASGQQESLEEPEEG